MDIYYKSNIHNDNLHHQPLSQPTNSGKPRPSSSSASSSWIPQKWVGFPLELLGKCSLRNGFCHFGAIPHIHIWSLIYGWLVRDKWINVTVRGTGCVWFYFIFIYPIGFSDEIFENSFIVITKCRVDETRLSHWHWSDLGAILAQDLISDLFLGIVGLGGQPFYRLFFLPCRAIVALAALTVDGAPKKISGAVDTVDLPIAPTIPMRSGCRGSSCRSTKVWSSLKTPRSWSLTTAMTEWCRLFRRGLFLRSCQTLPAPSTCSQRETKWCRLIQVFQWLFLPTIHWMGSRWFWRSRSRVRLALRALDGMVRRQQLCRTRLFSLSRGRCSGTHQQATQTWRSTTGMRSCSIGSSEASGQTQTWQSSNSSLTSTWSEKWTKGNRGSQWWSPCSSATGYQFWALSAGVAHTQ